MHIYHCPIKIITGVGSLSPPSTINLSYSSFYYCISLNFSLQLHFKLSLQSFLLLLSQPKWVGFFSSNYSSFFFKNVFGIWGYIPSRNVRESNVSKHSKHFSMCVFDILSILFWRRSCSCTPILAFAPIVWSYQHYKYVKDTIQLVDCHQYQGCLMWYFARSFVIGILSAFPPILLL